MDSSYLIDESIGIKINENEQCVKFDESKIITVDKVKYVNVESIKNASS